MVYKSDTQSVTIWTMTTVNVCNTNDEGLYSCIISTEVFLEKMDSCSRGQQINQNKLLCKKSYIHGGKKATKQDSADAFLLTCCFEVWNHFGVEKPLTYFILILPPCCLTERRSVQNLCSRGVFSLKLQPGVG